MINLEKTSRFGIEEEQLSTVNEKKEKDGGFKREWGSSKAKVKPKGAYEDLEASFSSLSSLRRSAVPGFELSEKLLKQKENSALLKSSSPSISPRSPRDLKTPRGLSHDIYNWPSEIIPKLHMQRTESSGLGGSRRFSTSRRSPKSSPDNKMREVRRSDRMRSEAIITSEFVVAQ